jgi:hypothetical protein
MADLHPGVAEALVVEVVLVGYESMPVIDSEGVGQPL